MDSSPYGQNWGGELLLAALRVPGGRYGWKTAHASRIVACCPSGLREQHLTCLKEKAAAANMNVGEPSSEEGLLPRAWPRWELQRCEGWPWRVESEGASCWPPQGGGPPWRSSAAIAKAFACRKVCVGPLLVADTGAVGIAHSLLAGPPL